MSLSKIQFGNTGRRNLVINGAMQVAQRATSVGGVGGDAGYKTIDRFRQNTTNTAGRLTMSQSTVTDLPGFANALKLDCTTADTSIAVSEVGIIQYRFEGQDVQQIKKGTSSAEPVTVSFYVKGNASATYTVELEDSDNSFRANSQEFSVTSSWTRVIKTFVADTTGTLDDDANQSLQLNFWFHGGSNYTSGTFASNTWHTDQTKRIGTNANSFFDSTARTLEITGLQVEVGDTATEFEHRSFNEELLLCKRYFEVYAPVTNDDGSLNVWRTRTSVNNYNGIVHFLEKRAQPTCAMNYDRIHKPGVAKDTLSSTGITIGSGQTTSCTVNATPTNDSSISTSCFLGMSSGTGRLTLDAEL